MLPAKQGIGSISPGLVCEGSCEGFATGQGGYGQEEVENSNGGKYFFHKEPHVIIPQK